MPTLYGGRFEGNSMVKSACLLDLSCVGHGCCHGRSKGGRFPMALWSDSLATCPELGRIRHKCTIRFRELVPISATAPPPAGSRAQPGLGAQWFGANGSARELARRRKAATLAWLPHSTLLHQRRFRARVEST